MQIINMNYSLRDLIDQGKSQGYLDADEIKKYLPETITSKKSLDEIFRMIEDMNIFIIKSE